MVTTFIKKILLRFLFYLGCFMPDKLFLQLKFWAITGRRLHLSHPITFFEKIQWLKLYHRLSEYTTMVDKYAVKEYVAQKIGAQYVIPTLGVWNSVDEIEWDALPPQFVLKTTHDGGSGGVVICKNKASLNRAAVIAKLKKSFRQSVYNKFREWPYKDVPRKIIAEKYMQAAHAQQDDDLTDYKFFCFDGKPVFCQVIKDRRTHETIDFFDMDWVHQPFCGVLPTIDSPLSYSSRPIPRPKHLEEMREISARLSQGIPFLRVDLYDIDDKIYFGELTFYPASGMGFFNPAEWAVKLGNYIHLPQKTIV